MYVLQVYIFYKLINKITIQNLLFLLNITKYIYILHNMISFRNKYILFLPKSF